jgi:hypothetical protein
MPRALLIWVLTAAKIGVAMIALRIRKKMQRAMAHL